MQWQAPMLRAHARGLTSRLISQKLGQITELRLEEGPHVALHA
jgi:hypothetical protein